MIDCLINGESLSEKFDIQIKGIGGRESVPYEIETKTYSNRPGSVIASRRIPEKNLQVVFRMKCLSAEEWWDKYNDLIAYTNLENAEFIFTDEADKYWIGTVEGVDLAEFKGKVFLFGSFTVKCADYPFKYAVDMKEVDAELHDGVLSAVCQNDGNAPAMMEYEITNKAENGYFSIQSSEGLMEFGLKEEPDKEYDAAVVDKVNADVLNAPMDRNPPYMDWEQYGAGRTLTNYTRNIPGLGVRQGIKLDLLTGEDKTKKGNVGAKTLTLDVPSNNCLCHFFLYFYCLNQIKTGEFKIRMLDEEDKEICCFAVYKFFRTNLEGWVYFSVNETLRWTAKFETGNNINNPFNETWRGHEQFSKVGDTASVYFYGTTYKFQDPAIADRKVAKICIWMGCYPDPARDSTRVDMEMYEFSVTRYDGERDIRNRFAPGTKLEIADGLFTIDGVYKPEEEVKGTQYFEIPPKKSTSIEFNTSDWCTQKPDVKVRWRERWR